MNFQHENKITISGKFAEKPPFFKLLVSLMRLMSLISLMSLPKTKVSNQENALFPENCLLRNLHFK
jgi:hypothetical protein